MLNPQIAANKTKELFENKTKRNQMKCMKYKRILI